MNTIVLMGRLARDPETKLTSTQKGQTKVSRFPLVVKRNRTSKAFVVMITAYGNNAEFVEKYLEKGIKIALSGELVISQIKDEQTGTASYYTEVIMDDVEFAEILGKLLGGKQTSKVTAHLEALEELLTEEEYSSFLAEYLGYLTVNVAEFIRSTIIENGLMLLAGTGGEEDGEDGL